MKRITKNLYGLPVTLALRYVVSFRGDYRRFLALSGDDRRLLFEAAIALLVSCAAIRWLPFRKVVASSVLRRGGENQGANLCTGEISRVTWAVNALARRLPLKIVCFQKGLAVHHLLRRRGIGSLLHYGVRQDRAGLKAHVWVTYAGKPVIGGDEAIDFTCLATFPSSVRSAPAGR